ncbi:type II secretion system F family protein [Sabulicella glaciei]|uniref:Type II secretion system F family protein n=1 Tax=Sabulicella glaciei TaxID=2984948 RepID=A0ABT3NQ88_9PROT|nr:type II secretion system F family protein [Roseococcus sp. MDT2-1-1]MCW8084327.1 type II secretion system F family protein [Roseococcus sp. MDT2-1-1]
MNALALALIAGFGSLLLVSVASFLLNREAARRDLSRRIRGLSRSDEDREAAGGAPVLGGVIGLLRQIGEALRRRSIFSPPEVSQLEQAIAASGLPLGQAVPIFIGTKVVLLLLSPLAGLAVALLRGSEAHGILLSVAFGLIIGIMLPGWILKLVRKPYIKALQRGLPDSLDLLVVCAEAGLGLDSAVERVAVEMRASNPAVAREFGMLGQELRMLPDRREALNRLGERTGLDGFRRVSATLSQTFRYGTPLAQALRVLAAEMRQERMTSLEERAARLPALLVMPLILFIMPCLFIVLIGPSIIQLSSHFGG